MEREIKLLKDKVQDLSQENVALREINVQFQLDNFKLQQKIKKLENSQFSEAGGGAATIHDSTFDPNAEYLMDDDEMNQPTMKKAKLKQTKARHSRSVKRSYEEDIEEEEPPEVGEEKPMIKEELIITDARTDNAADGDYFPDPEMLPDSDVEVDESFNIDPKEAATTVYKLAAKRGVLDKLKMIDKGKSHDSFFVNKALDLFFDRKTLAASSARGKQSQTLLHIPPRPALDPKKTFLCRQAFLYRLKREGLTMPAQEERLKLFNSYVNSKIQNTRKLFRKLAKV